MLRDVIDLLPFMIVIFNREGYIEQANASFLAHFGLTRASFDPGKGFGELVHCENAAKGLCGSTELCQTKCGFRSVIMQAIQRGSLADHDYVIEGRHAEGRQASYFNLRGFPHKDFIILCIEDVTAKRRLEMSNIKIAEVQARNQTIRRLALEINNPLTIALGNCKLILQDSAHSRRADEIMQALRRMTTTMDDLRALVENQTE